MGKDGTEREKMERGGTGENRTGLNGTERDWTEREKTGEVAATQDETERDGTGHNGWDGTGSDRNIWNWVGQNRRDRTI